MSRAHYANRICVAWSDTEELIVIIGAELGFSGTQLADVLGRSRSAVLSLAFRKNIRFEGSSGVRYRGNAPDRAGIARAIHARAVELELT